MIYLLAISIVGHIVMAGYYGSIIAGIVREAANERRALENRLIALTDTDAAITVQSVENDSQRAKVRVYGEGQRTIGDE